MRKDAFEGDFLPGPRKRHGRSLHRASANRERLRHLKRERIVPKVPRCIDCKVGKVLHHHWLCDLCWESKRKKGVLRGV